MLLLLLLWFSMMVVFSDLVVPIDQDQRMFHDQARTMIIVIVIIL